MNLDEEEILTTGVELLARSSGKSPTIHLTVSGRSMGNLLLPGDRIECKRVGPGRIFCGDIVVYRRENRLIAHRVVRRMGKDGDLRFQTRGDAQIQSDAVIGQDEILGRVVAVHGRDGEKIGLERKKTIIVNRIAGFYGRFLHHFMTHAGFIDPPLRRFLPLPQLRRLMMTPFQLLTLWIRGSIGRIS